MKKAWIFAVELALLVGVSSCSSVPQPHPMLRKGWIFPEVSDCPLSTGVIGSTLGSATPSPAKCSSSTQSGMLAECWDQKTYTNSGLSGPGCVYTLGDNYVSCKDDGPHPGRLYTCNY